MTPKRPNNPPNLCDNNNIMKVTPLICSPEDVVLVARLESFRALKLSKSESFRALKLSKFETFRALKLSNFESNRVLKY